MSALDVPRRARLLPRVPAFYVCLICFICLPYTSHLGVPRRARLLPRVPAQVARHQGGVPDVPNAGGGGAPLCVCLTCLPCVSALSVGGRSMMRRWRRRTGCASSTTPSRSSRSACSTPRPWRRGRSDVPPPMPPTPCSRLAPYMSALYVCLICLPYMSAAFHAIPQAGPLNPEPQILKP